MKRTRRNEEGGEEMTTHAARGTEEKSGEAENQYEIILARASAKLQVIKRADKQMKQRETRGAALVVGRGGTKGGREYERELQQGRGTAGEADLGHKYIQPDTYAPSASANKRAQTKKRALIFARNKLNKQSQEFARANF